MGLEKIKPRDFFGNSDFKLSEDFMGVKIPYIIKNATLISPGTWNNVFYTGDVISDAHKKTDWKNKTIRNLYLDHQDDRTSEWVGHVINPRFSNGIEYGDLEIFDPITAVKLAKGKPKFGISPRVRGIAEDGVMKKFLFENFSFVINPACKTTYINNMEVKNMDLKIQSEDESKVETPKPEKMAEKTKEKPEAVVSEVPKELAEKARLYDQMMANERETKFRAELKEEILKELREAKLEEEKPEEEPEAEQEEEKTEEAEAESPDSSELEEIKAKLAELEKENKELNMKLSQPGERATVKTGDETCLKDCRKTQPLRS